MAFAGCYLLLMLLSLVFGPIDAYRGRLMLPELGPRRILVGALTGAGLICLLTGWVLLTQPFDY